MVQSTKLSLCCLSVFTTGASVSSKSMSPLKVHAVALRCRCRGTLWRWLHKICLAWIQKSVLNVNKHTQVEPSTSASFPQSTCTGLQLESAFWTTYSLLWVLYDYPKTIVLGALRIMIQVQRSTGAKHTSFPIIPSPRDVTVSRLRLRKFKRLRFAIYDWTISIWPIDTLQSMNSSDRHLSEKLLVQLFEKPYWLSCIRLSQYFLLHIFREESSEVYMTSQGWIRKL